MIARFASASTLATIGLLSCALSIGSALAQEAGVPTGRAPIRYVNEDPENLRGPAFAAIVERVRSFVRSLPGELTPERLTVHARALDGYFFYRDGHLSIAAKIDDLVETGARQNPRHAGIISAHELAHGVFDQAVRNADVPVPGYREMAERASALYERTLDIDRLDVARAANPSLEAEYERAVAEKKALFQATPKSDKALIEARKPLTELYADTLAVLWDGRLDGIAAALEKTHLSNDAVANDARRFDAQRGNVPLQKRNEYSLYAEARLEIGKRYLRPLIADRSDSRLANRRAFIRAFTRAVVLEYADYIAFKGTSDPMADIRALNRGLIARIDSLYRR